MFLNYDDISIKWVDISYHYSAFHHPLIDVASCTEYQIWNLQNLLALPVTANPESENRVHKLLKNYKTFGMLKILF